MKNNAFHEEIHRMIVLHGNGVSSVLIARRGALKKQRGLTSFLFQTPLSERKIVNSEVSERLNEPTNLVS